MLGRRRDVGRHRSFARIDIAGDVRVDERRTVSRTPYPAIRRWTDRVKRITGFVVMPGIFPVDPL